MMDSLKLVAYFQQRGNTDESESTKWRLAEWGCYLDKCSVWARRYDTAIIFMAAIGNIQSLRTSFLVWRVHLGGSWDIEGATRYANIHLITLKWTGFGKWGLQVQGPVVPGQRLCITMLKSVGPCLIPLGTFHCVMLVCKPFGISLTHPVTCTPGKRSCLPLCAESNLCLYFPTAVDVHLDFPQDWHRRWNLHKFLAYNKQ